MSAEPVAPTPQCLERKPVWLPADPERWRCYLDDEDNLALYCPECSERELGNDRRT